MGGGFQVGGGSGNGARMRWFTLPLLALLCLPVWLAWWLPNRPQNPEPDVHVAKFESLSFEAYRAWESPLTDTFPTEAEAEADVAQLAKVTTAVRTYAAIEGSYDIAALAQKHGLKLWQGIWLGADRAKNKLEMARAIKLAAEYPNTIERVIVGNEVLLRRDLPPAELMADIDQVKAAVKQPVAYADVWDFWKQFPEVAAHVDIMLIHLLPYWEDVPTGIDHAVAHVGDAYHEMKNLFPNKQIAIGETGWPSRGRERADAVPSRVNETRFLRGFIKLSRAEHFDYNFIEAYDEIWKYESEGIVGANWGIFNADRVEKIPLQGPVVENPAWRTDAMFSIAAGLALTLIGLWRAPPITTSRHTLLCGASMLLGTAFGFATANALATLYDIHLQIAAVANLAGQLALAILAMRRLTGAIRPAPGRTGADATSSLQALIRRAKLPALHGLFEDLLFLFAWTAAVMQTLLVFDPRYREFPISTFVVPLLITAGRLLCADLPRVGGARAEWLVAGTLVAGAAASAIQEGPLNHQSLAWNACVVLLALPLLMRLPLRKMFL
jgi:exo-beta-1,3-glucanase (GH17 family)